MSTLLIRFHEASLDRFSWIVEGAQAGNEVEGWRPGSASELGVLSRNHSSVVFIIPQQCVYLTRFEIPPHASRQVLSSIEYQIEDQFAQDVEQLHLALGDQSSSSVAIAVVEKTLMERCLELQQIHGISVSRIVPELFLCPWSGEAGELSLIESNNGLVLRYGEYQGLECRSEMLDPVLNRIAQQQEISNVIYYLPNRDLYDTLRQAKYPSQHRVPDLSQVKIDRTVSIDLQQRQFQVSSVWIELFRVWRWIIALLALMFVVAGYNKALALQDMEVELARIEATQYQLIKPYLPDNIDASANLKKALITLLRQNQSNQQETDFLGLLSAFTQAKVEYPAIAIDKISYQKGRLSIDVKSAQLSSIEALLQVLESSGQAARLENLDIKPETTTGRFLLTGDST
ncbi:MAG: type II secretion system protein GspL [Gammaproteobacteria bacterium]